MEVKYWIYKLIIDFLLATRLLAKFSEIVLKGLNGFDLKEEEKILKSSLLEYRVDFLKSEKDRLQIV